MHLPHLKKKTEDALREEKQYKIVGDDEADFKAGKISVNSPIARGLIGKSEGDEARIETPKGIVEYEIMKVIYD